MSKEFIKFKKLYDKNYVFHIMKSICKKANIKLIEEELNNNNKNDINCIYSCGNEIILMPFVCENALERQFISFFDAYARCKLYKKIPFRIIGYHCNNTSKMQYELQIVRLALEYAKKKGIVFSDDAVEWLINEKLSYKKIDTGEISKILFSDNISYVISYEHCQKLSLFEKIKKRIYNIFSFLK